MSNQGGIQYDERGRPFTYVGNTTRKSYISPVAMGTGTRPTDGGGIFKTDYGWDQDKGDWTRGVDWGNIATLGVGGALAAPFVAPVVGGLFGGGGGAATGGTAAATGLSESVIPTTLGTTGLPGAAAAGTAAGTAGGAKVGGMGLGKLLGLSGIGEGMDLLGGWLGQKMGVDEKPRQSFAGKTGSNGVSVDPTEIYSQGLGLLQGLVPQMQDRIKKPVSLKGLIAQPVAGLSGVDPAVASLRRRDPGQGGDFEEASFLLKLLGL